MNKTIIIRTDQLRARAVEILSTLPLSPVHEVVFKEHKESRSLRQLALLWKWNTIIGNELGNTKDEQHDYYKETFLVPIFTRDDPEYAAMVASVKHVRAAGMAADADALKKQIVKLTSTTDCDTKQMAEYMRDIDHHAASLDIMLPRPDDPKDLMVGKK
jgi:hypothetical protein